MLRTFNCFCLLLLFFKWGNAQKVIEKEIVNPSSKFVEINTANCFQVDIDTHMQESLRVEASMEGEYAKDLAVKVEEAGKNIRVSVGFLPSFDHPNDKLSAHKVTSVLLSVTLPDYMQTKVYGTNSNVDFKGSYKHLSVVLSDGNCSFDNVSENITVKTQKGKVVLHNINGTIRATSEYGKIYRNNVAKGHQQFDIQSVEGDILINYP